MPTPAAYHHDQAAATRFIVFVLFQMLRELLYAVRKDRHLNLGGPGVAIMPMVLTDQLVLLFPS